MTRAALLAALALAGCQTARTVATPVVSCSDARFSDRSAHMAADLDEPPEPVGGLDAVASRVRLSPEGGPRIARAEDRYAVVRAAVDATGAVLCSDVVEASSVGRGEAAQRAVHASAFTPPAATAASRSRR